MLLAVERLRSNNRKKWMRFNKNRDYTTRQPLLCTIYLRPRRGRNDNFLVEKSVVALMVVVSSFPDPAPGGGADDERGRRRARQRYA